MSPGICQSLPERISVLGAPVDVVDMDRALEVVDRQVRTATTPGYVLAVNPEKVIMLRNEEWLRKFFASASLLIPDGIGVVLGARLLCRSRMRRVAGADLMQAICAAAVEKGYRIFIFGATEEVNKAAVAVLRRRYPGIDIVGRSNGYVNAQGTENLIRAINESRADVLFVALGSPRQERWIAENLPKLNVGICQGLGGTLDTIAGTVKRAPKWVQSLGLEWLYRRKGFRRYIRLARFAAGVLVVKATRGA